MASNPNLELLRGAYARWGETKGGNVGEILDMFDDSIEMRSALTEDVPDAIAGTKRSRAEAASYFEGLLRDWEMVSFEAERFIDGGDEIVMVGRCAWRNRATGRIVESPKVDIHSFRNGKVVRFQEVYDTLGFARALGAV
jgi:ketosteroid isomerase-like protein